MLPHLPWAVVVMDKNVMDKNLPPHQTAVWTKLISRRWVTRNSCVSSGGVAMNLTNLRTCVLPKWSILLVLLSLTAVASAAGPTKQSEHKSGGSKPASHASAQHGGGHQASGGHAAEGGRGAQGGHAAEGGHAAQGGHGAQGGHAAEGGHAAQGGRGAQGGHAAEGGHAVQGSRGAQGGREAHGGRPGGSGHTPAGTRNVSLRGGGSASVRSNGQIRSINRGGMHISNGLHGGRTVVGMHNGARVVNIGRHGGYVQRPYRNFGGHAYYSRTYFSGGHYYTGVYRGYSWHGHMYYGYHPGFWYHPGFYGWGYHPWGIHLAWWLGLWGWGGAPWYGFYGGWFAPYPYYAGP